jgi:sigma-E factor negative regulatory protein RseC
MRIVDAEETVKVTLIKDGFAYVETAKASACGSCASKSSCGSFNFFSANQQKKSPELGLRVKNTLNLKAGDSAVLTLSSEKLLLGTLLLYLFPIIILLVSASIAKYFAGELLSTFFGLFGFTVSLLFVRSILQKQKAANQFEPTLLRKIINIETK